MSAGRSPVITENVCLGHQFSSEIMFVFWAKLNVSLLVQIHGVFQYIICT